MPVRQPGGHSNGPRPNQRSGHRRQFDQRTSEYHTSRAHNLGGDQVEGHRAVYELLKANRRKVQTIYFEEGIDRSGIVKQIADFAFNHRVPIQSISSSRFSHIAGSELHQGVVAVAAPIRALDLEEIVASNSKAANLLVLDHITDPRNLGAILRSAECAGVTGVIIPEHRACRLTPSATKTAAGAIEYLNFSLASSIPGALSDLKALGVWSVGLDMDAEANLSQINLLTSPVALVLGAEGKGLSKLTKARCDLLAKIPQFGRVESLNVSAAATLAVYEVARARGTLI